MKYKYDIGILVRIVLKLWIALGSMDILMMLILPVHEHGMCELIFKVKIVDIEGLSKTIGYTKTT